MDCSKTIARKLCEELDIEWDETTNTPKFQDTEITSERFVEIFFDKGDELE